MIRRCVDIPKYKKNAKHILMENNDFQLVIIE